MIVDRPPGWDGGTLLALGHGAGGDVDAPDIMAVRRAVLGAGGAVARITQPYRVAGRRTPAPAPQLDTAWLAVLADVAKKHPARRLIVGGRSSGARVACRTAVAASATGIVCLAFPLHPPGKPEKSRADELLTGVPTLVINGDRDAFGIPSPGDHVEVVVLPGETHSLNKNVSAVGAAVVGWLSALAA